MCDQTNDTDNEQAIEDNLGAVDAEAIKERLPEDVRARLTKRAFSPGAIKALLRDTYYAGPIATGTGGWRGIYGGGQPGTGLRRPRGAFHGQPRSWRFAAMERALNTGLVTRVDAGWVATERGVAVLHAIDRCEVCGARREPMVKTSTYKGAPSKPAQVSKSLVTACPEHGTTGYGGRGSSATTGYSRWEPSEERTEWASEVLATHPEARAYGLNRDVASVDEAAGNGLTDEEIADVLAEHIESHTPPTPREVFGGVTEDLYGNPVLAVGDETGAHYSWYANEQSTVVKRTDETAEVHFEVDNAEEGTLKAVMTKEVAVDRGAKEALKAEGQAKWHNSRQTWTLKATDLPHAINRLAGEYFGPRFGDEDVEVRLTVSATAEAVALVDNPMVGVDAEGNLIGINRGTDDDEDEDGDNEQDESTTEESEDAASEDGATTETKTTAMTDGGQEDVPNAEDYGHAGPLVAETLNTRLHDNVPIYRCETCNVLVERTKVERLQEHDCENYARLRRKSLEETNDLMTDGGEEIVDEDHATTVERWEWEETTSTTLTLVGYNASGKAVARRYARVDTAETEVKVDGKWQEAHDRGSWSLTETIESAETKPGQHPHPPMELCPPAEK